MDDANALGTLIRQARLDNGLSLVQLASAVGRSSSSIRRWERGETSPSSSVIGDLADVLGLDPNVLSAMVARTQGTAGGGTASRVAVEMPAGAPENGTVEPDVSEPAAPGPAAPEVAGGEGADDPVTGPLDGGAVDVPPQPPELTTLEDEAGVVEVAQYFEHPEPADAVVVVDEPAPWQEWFAGIWGRRDLWIGWVRGILTAIALVFLFMGLIWALGELMDALKAVSGSFSTGA